MPSVSPSISLDLSRYGLQGEMILDEPTLGRLDRLERTVLQLLLNDKEREQYHSLPTKDRPKYLQQFIDDNIFTYNILLILSYVKSAPFLILDGKLLPYHDFISKANESLKRDIHWAIEQLQQRNPFALMNTELDMALGLRMFQDAVLKGTQNETTLYYIMYATYLKNGGSKSDWMQLTQTDITLMMLCDIKTADRNNKNLAHEITNAIGKSLNGGGGDTTTELI